MHYAIGLGNRDFFFFQAEDGIRDLTVTGVQTCALPILADMPFGSYHSDTAESLRNAVRFVKEAGAEAVKVEGGERRLELIARLTEAEIPVMGHIGLKPQSVNALGG